MLCFYSCLFVLDLYIDCLLYCYLKKNIHTTNGSNKEDNEINSCLSCNVWSPFGEHTSIICWLKTATVFYNVRLSMIKIWQRISLKWERVPSCTLIYWMIKKNTNYCRWTRSVSNSYSTFGTRRVVHFSTFTFVDIIFEKKTELVLRQLKYTSTRFHPLGTKVYVIYLFIYSF